MCTPTVPWRTPSDSAPTRRTSTTDSVAGQHAVDDGGDELFGDALTADQLRVDEWAGDQRDEQVDIDIAGQLAAVDGSLDHAGGEAAALLGLGTDETA